MESPYTLMTPGPVPVPQEVLNTLAQPMIHHRTPEFETVLRRVLDRLQTVFQTTQPVFLHTSTGSGAMESAVVNTLSSDDEVVNIVSGKFGERWADIASLYGANVKRVNIPWGEAITPEQLREVLRQTPNAKAVFCQACETSTGVLHPIKELAAVVAETEAIFVVDGITASGAMPMPMDEWGIDVIVAGSQKAFMLPTGLSFISFSQKAWSLVESARTPRYYFDVRPELKANKSNQTRFSSAVNLIRALDAVLEIFLTRGPDSIYQRVEKLALATREASGVLGLKLFPQRPSPTLTTLLLPEGVDGQKIRSQMENKYRVTVMGGQDQLKGKVIRIGHMGAISDEDMMRTIEALGLSLKDLAATSVTDEKVQNAVSVCRNALMK